MWYHPTLVDETLGLHGVQPFCHSFDDLLDRDGLLDQPLKSFNRCAFDDCGCVVRAGFRIAGCDGSLLLRPAGGYSIYIHPLATIEAVQGIRYFPIFGGAVLSVLYGTLTSNPPRTLCGARDWLRLLNASTSKPAGGEFARGPALWLCSGFRPSTSSGQALRAPASLVLSLP